MLAEEMLAQISCHLGVGALLGWAALPLLFRFARRSRQASPTAYYRALVAALAIAAVLSFAPALRALVGVAVELPLGPRPWAGLQPLTLVADWVTPLIGSRAEPWQTMPLARMLSALGLLWLTTLAFGVLRSLAGRFRLARAYRGARAAPTRVLERAAAVAAELGIAPPPIRVAEGVASAFTFGVFSPLVLLGPDACQDNDDALDFTLRHELTHVARGDARAALWIELVQRCFSGHPSRRALEREIRFAREAAVDEAAAGTQTLEYARFLLGLAEKLESVRAPHASFMSMADTALERRIEMLISRKQTQRAGRSAAWLGLSGLTLGALVFLAPSSFGQSGDQVDMPTELSLPLEERNARAEAKEGVSHRLPAKVIQDTVRGYFDRFGICYEAFPHPRPTTTAKLKFTIGRDGKVVDGEVEAKEYPSFAKCLDPVMRSMVFPAPGDGIVTVEYPVAFAP